MEQEIINNDESGAVVREKLNNNFSELYAQAGTRLWELVNEIITAKYDDVAVRNLHLHQLNVLSNFQVLPDGTIISETLGNETNLRRLLSVGSNGHFDTQMLGTAPVRRVSVHDYLLTENDYSVIVYTVDSAAIVRLPALATHQGKAFNIRRAPSNFPVIVQTSGAEVILPLSLDGTSATTYTLGLPNEWITVRALADAWVIEAFGGREAATGGAAGGGAVDRVRIVSANYLIRNTDYALMCDNTTNIQLSLPAIGLNSVEFVIRKTRPNAFAVTLLRSGTNNVQLNVSFGMGVTTTTAGSYLRIISMPSTGVWHVIEGGGGWSIVT